MREVLRTATQRLRTAASPTARRSAYEAADEDPEVAAGDGLSYLFIVTYGRSGSTLLQGILNSLPGYLIRGENRDALRHLFTFRQTCLAEQQRLARSVANGNESDDTRHPFFGISDYDDEAALAGLRTAVVSSLLRPEPETTVTGFKEIRWYTDDITDYVEFLMRLFPGARFLINTRDHADVAKSKWWAKHDDPLGELERIEQRLDAIEERVGDRGYRVHYDDYATDPDALRGMHEWLGADFDAQRIADVQSTRHST